MDCRISHRPFAGPLRHRSSSAKAKMETGGRRLGGRKSGTHLRPPSIFQAALFCQLSKQCIPGARLARLPG
jgi:hypothetical protein